MGRRWAFHTRNVFKKAAIDDSIWAKQKRPIRLLASRAERDTAYKALLDVKDRGKNIDRWNLGKEIARSLMKMPPRQKRHSAVRKQKGNGGGGRSVAAAQSRDKDKAGGMAEMEPVAPAGRERTTAGRSLTLCPPLHVPTPGVWQDWLRLSSSRPDICIVLIAWPARLQYVLQTVGGKLFGVVTGAPANTLGQKK